jgi:hypothetical protein
MVPADSGSIGLQAVERLKPAVDRKNRPRLKPHTVVR